MELGFERGEEEEKEADERVKERVEGFIKDRVKNRVPVAQSTGPAETETKPTTVGRPPGRPATGKN